MKLQKGIDCIGIAVVFFCHDGKGNYLLNKRSEQCRDEHGCWDPGGGGLEFGDDVIQTLKREIAEEYCTEVLEHEFLGYRDVHREHNGQKTHWIAMDFRVLIERAKVRNGEPKKLQELQWFKVKDFPQPLHSQFPHALEKYKDKLV